MNAITVETVEMLEQASALMLQALRQSAKPQQGEDAGALEYDSWAASGAREYDSWLARA